MEEAIKDVDLSGLAFIRYDNAKSKYTNGSDSDSTWKFRAVANLQTKIDDNFFFLAGIRYGVDTPDVDSGSHLSTSVGGNTDKKFMLNQLLVGWTPGADTTIMAGRYVLGTFFTDDMYGDGVKIVNTGIEGMTLAALWADALEADGDIGTLGLDLGLTTTNQQQQTVPVTDTIQFLTGKKVTDHNLYGVAAIGSYNPISYQMWYAYLQDVVALFAVEAALNFDISDDVNFGVKGQYAFSDFDGEFKDLVPVGDSKFWGVEASTEVFGFDLSGGYVRYEAKDNLLGLSSFEDNGAFISAGEDLASYPAYLGKNSYWFVTAGYTIPNIGLRIGADYLKGKFGIVDLANVGVGEREKAEEIVGRIEYDYSAKLNLTGWYSHIDWKDADAEDDHFRIQATYKF